jgi:hypothetical protein
MSNIAQKRSRAWGVWAFRDPSGNCYGIVIGPQPRLRDDPFSEGKTFTETPGVMDESSCWCPQPPKGFPRLKPGECVRLIKQ